MNYFSELTRAMNMLAADARTLFVGQGVRWDNNAQFRTLEGVPDEKRIELPVIEDFMDRRVDNQNPPPVRARGLRGDERIVLEARHLSKSFYAREKIGRASCRERV